MDSAKQQFTYKDAGVDIDAGDELVERIKPAVKRSLRPGVMGGLGAIGQAGRCRAGPARKQGSPRRVRPPE